MISGDKTDEKESSLFVRVLSGAVDNRAGWAQTSPPPELDAFVARALKEFEVPGIAIAIVKDGKVALTRGYGVRKLGKTALVDEQTLFSIASNTKAFNAASLAIMVDEGKTHHLSLVTFK